MDPRRKPDPRTQDDRVVEGPALETQDWDAIASGEITPDSVPENGDLRYDVEPSGELPGEEDDNAYQESDEALPDDRDEAAIARNLSTESGRSDPD